MGSSEEQDRQENGDAGEPDLLSDESSETKLDVRSSDDLSTQRLDRNEARKLIALIQRTGTASYTGHCERALRDDNMCAVDADNVMRCGKILRQPEQKFDAWRYVVETDHMAVVVEIHSMASIRVITAWRKK